MSKIVSPVPVKIYIEYNEINGQVEFKAEKDIPFPVIVAIFSQLMIKFADNGLRLMEKLQREIEAATAAAGGTKIQ